MATRTLTIGILVIALIGLAAPVTAQPEDQPPSLGSAGLPDRTEIDVWVKYWIDRIATATTEADLTEARGRLVTGYQRFEPTRYRYDYADITAARVSAMLKALPDDDLKTLREVNAASVIGVLDQVSVQFTLQELVAHENPAVRYWGWKSFTNIRDLAMAQGGQTVQGLFTALTQRSAAETSAIVFGAMWETMILPASPPEAVDSATWTAVIETFTDIIRSTGAGACEQVTAGDTSWTSAAGKGVQAMTRLARATGEEELSIPLSHLLHMTFAAFRAYDAAPANSEAERHAIVLMAACESAFVGLTGLSGSPGIEATLIDPGYRTKDAQSAATGLAIAQWKDKLVEQYAAQPPPISLIADAPAPDGAGEADDDEAP